jgi:hypothetical protein
VQRGSLIYVSDEKWHPLDVFAGGQGTKRRAARIHVLDRQRASRLVDLYLRRKGPTVEFDIGGAMTTTFVERGATFGGPAYPPLSDAIAGF